MSVTALGSKSRKGVTVAHPRWVSQIVSLLEETPN